MAKKDKTIVTKNTGKSIIELTGGYAEFKKLKNKKLTFITKKTKNK